MDAVTEANREAWEAASRKHVREYDDLLAQAEPEPAGDQDGDSEQAP